MTRTNPTLGVEMDDEIPIVTDPTVKKDEAFLCIPGKEVGELQWMKVEGLEVSLEEQDELKELRLYNANVDIDAMLEE